jgi:hypothetical protein
VQINREKLKDKLFLDEHRDESFSCHLAVNGANVEVSHYLHELSEEGKIQGDDLRSVVLLAQDKCGKTTWQ